MVQDITLALTSLSEEGGPKKLSDVLALGNFCGGEGERGGSYLHITFSGFCFSFSFLYHLWVIVKD